MKKNGYLLKLNKAHRNAGFTLIELVVVLALMAILLSVTIFGGLAWQDWMRFQHEDSVAEELFFAAQNQLVELDASGATERVVERPLLQADGSFDGEYVLASFSGESGELPKEGKLTSIIPQNGGDEERLSWETLWAKSEEPGAAIGLNVNMQDRKTILSLSARSGDYEKYLTYKSASADVRRDMLDAENGISTGTVVLFDLVAPYISDTSALNGALILEFSPETGQVFSALYSDRASVLDYGTAEDTKGVSVLDRRISAREPLMLGYYGVDQLTEKIRGKGVAKSNVRLELRNEEVLSLVLHDNEGSVLTTGAVYDFAIYDGKSVDDDKAMTFTISYDQIQNDVNTLADAAAHPLTVQEVTFHKGIYEGQKLPIRFPVWIEGSNIHIILDAADVQAQTSIYGAAKAETEEKKLDKESKSAKFRNTYSFYRFGLADQLNYIYASVEAKPSADADVPVVYSVRDTGEISGTNPTGYADHKSLAEEEGSCGECTTFASYALKNVEETQEGEQGETVTSATEKRCFEIANARHLYNLRYETEYKDSGAKPNVFTLVADIDWNTFVNKAGESGKDNYFLNSYDGTVDNTQRVAAGIDYSGYHIATGGTGTSTDVYTETKDMPFPGFRCLGKGDTFTQAVAYSVEDPEETGTEGAATQTADSGSYTISNLTISFAANVVYGIYDDVLDTVAGAISKTGGEIRDAEGNVLYTVAPTLKGDCLDGDFSGLLGLEDASNTYTYDANEAASGKLSSRARLARGGALPLGLFSENLGTIENLTLANHTVRGIESAFGSGTNGARVDTIVATNMVGGFAGNNLGWISNLTLLGGSEVSGRTDVGGIIGRESYIVTDAGVNTASADVVISGMKNYGTVTGLEYVGGIVGRAYTHFIGETSQENNYSSGFALKASDKILTKEEQNPRYQYYHDRYFISDTNRSMTGASVARVKKITMENCDNRGIVSGASIYGNGSNLKMKTEDNKDARCSFIGGIAGGAIDGYIADHKDLRIGSRDGQTPLKKYYSQNYFSGELSYIEIIDCTSYVKGLDETLHTNDYFIGGLAGYARYATVEGCTGAPEADLYKEDAPDCYVTGRRYVGGLFGCSDLCIYKTKDDTEPYAVINYNNVIGDRCVGGIAGSTGIGDRYQESFSLWNPSRAEADLPSQYEHSDTYENDYKDYITERNMLNTAVVLGRKSGDSMNHDSIQSMIGGIFGASRSPFANADNIQPAAVKKLAMELITEDTQYSDANLYQMSATELQEMIKESRYGGICVGGIVGRGFGFDWMNVGNSDDVESRVDAVVFGQDYVGGIIGRIPDGGSKYYGAKNIYPVAEESEDETTKGMLVAGRDAVGGLYGVFCYENNNGNAEKIVNSEKITAPFKVIGRYGVGGLFGYVMSKNKTYTRPTRIETDLAGQGTRIKVNAIAYAGGIAGVLDKQLHTDSDVIVRDMDVEAQYFAGALYGAVEISGNEPVDFQEGTQHKISAERIQVKADACAGGIAGIWAGYGITSFGNTNTPGLLQQLAKNVDGKDVSAAYGVITKQEELSGSEATQTLSFNSYTNNQTSTNTKTYSSSASVEAKIFAGGLFGYVPDGLDITVTGFVNGSNIRTTGSVSGVSESFDTSAKYSYLGGVIGRVPAGMTLVNCANAVSGYYSGTGTTPEKYYTADQATWLGGLTEVNAGMITGTTDNSGVGDGTGYIQNTALIKYCENKTEHDYSEAASVKGVGAFAGVNGTRYTNGLDTGVIRFCSNRADIKAGTAAGIAAAIGGRSDIRYCENRGTIYSTDSTKGIAAG
ncbi:MAG: prepilin-type N-terminal cleavage/methylation domain-containing protein, partial [Eubacterium sp.]|nr:prepilin-type N-terminal cleavage/methylation domain-containing protein [Eubacterium sp.]